MIIVNLKGGIGNQLFQYALGRKLAIKNNDVLKLDTAGLDRANDVGDIYRPFALGLFNTVQNVATVDEVRKLKYPYGVLSKGLRWFRFKVLRDMHMGWEPSVLLCTGDMYLDGFWQSPKYFEDIRDVIISDLSFKGQFSIPFEKYEKMIHKSNAVSVHIRRGDYASNSKVQKAYGVCSLEYYQQAIAYINNNINNPIFYVFSDDISWVKENLNFGERVEYVTGKELLDSEEMILMSICKHNIIANSTFSWWGAWLNQNENKIVIAPTPWFNTNEKYFKDLIPLSWVRINKQ